MSASAVGRLKDGWLDEYVAWQKRDLSARRYVYIWADGIHLEARLEDEKQCILVLIGATPEGRKELVGFTDGARESAHDWRDLLLDLKRRGLDVSPRLVIADGALGFWKAAGEVWPTTREQRCWVHKTANVLAKLPKSQQPKAKRALQEIWMAEAKATAELAFDAFIESYTPKYEKAADGLGKDRDEAGLKVDFVEGRVDEAPRLASGPFDLVYVTWGTICWLPDLTVWAHVIATVLRPGGELYFADAHPSFVLMEERSGKLELTYDFETPADRPLPFKSETTYTGDPTVMTHQSTREWIHPLSAIIGALIVAGLNIKMLHEHQILPRRQLPMMVPATDGWWRLPDGHPRYPVSFSLRARKEQ